MAINHFEGQSKIAIDCSDLLQKIFSTVLLLATFSPLPLSSLQNCQLEQGKGDEGGGKGENNGKPFLAQTFRENHNFAKTI